MERPSGEPLFRIPVSELQQMAVEQGTNLILLGCETSLQMDGAPLSVGVIGRYKPASAARKIGAALAGAKDGAEFLRTLASKDMVIVAQPGTWSPDASGGALYVRVRGAVTSYVRVLRFWFIGR